MGRRAPSLRHSRPQPSTPRPLTGPLLGGVRLSRGDRRSHTQGGVELASGFEPGFRAAPFDATPTSDLGVPRVSADPALPRPAQCPWWPPTARACKPAPPPGPPRGPAPHGPARPPAPPRGARMPSTDRERDRKQRNHSRGEGSREVWPADFWKGSSASHVSRPVCAESLDVRKQPSPVDRAGHRTPARGEGPARRLQKGNTRRARCTRLYIFA